MKSTLCFPETSIQSFVKSQRVTVNQKATYSCNVNQKAIDSCIAAAWLDLVGGDFDSLAGDDWLGLCGDIDDGELYREWFLWQDSEVTQEWEAYDPITNYRVVASTREMLIAKIDQIEDTRNI